MVLEHPEEPVKAYVNAGGLDQRRLERIKPDPARIDLGSDVPVGEQHDGNLPVPVRCRRGSRYGGSHAGVVQWQNISFPS